jgi:formylglycine-generating enzyme required for sulfatase activity
MSPRIRLHGAAAMMATAMAAGCQLIGGIDARSLGVDGDAGGTTPFCDGGACLAEPPSCAQGGAGMTTCGGATSCCASGEVEGGVYDRSYDGLSAGYTSMAFPAKVTGFRLDRYEVTVGRFRPFIDAVAGGWLPGSGAGKHAYLNQGLGLNATAGGNEPGWDAVDWNANLAATLDDWTGNLSCISPGATWSASPGDGEALPINCVTWYEAYAFCIWDGGFLPSEAEWNYAAAGGAEQRAYPWSPPLAGAGSGTPAIGCSDADYSDCTSGATSAAGTYSPAGDGKWGQSDLAGNVWEWTLDWNASYVTPCTDCANLTAASERVLRGGSYTTAASFLLVSYRLSHDALTRDGDIGLRCARAP